MGKLLAICTSPQRGTVKTEVESARLTPEWGIETDAHGGNWHRQVSLLSAEKIENFRKKIWVDYGAFGENLVVEGYDFRNLPVTSRFAIGGRGVGNDPDRQRVPQRLRHQAEDRRVHHAPGGRVCPGAAGRRDPRGGRGDPAAPAGKSAPARCCHHPF